MQVVLEVPIKASKKKYIFFLGTHKAIILKIWNIYFFFVDFCFFTCYDQFVNTTIKFKQDKQAAIELAAGFINLAFFPQEVPYGK